MDIVTTVKVYKRLTTSDINKRICPVSPVTGRFWLLPPALLLAPSDSLAFALRIQRKTVLELSDREQDRTAEQENSNSKCVAKVIVLFMNYWTILVHSDRT